MPTKLLQRQSALLKALAHPKRLEILLLLGEHELPAGQIQDMAGFAQANLSQHLHLLKMAQVIIATRSGKQIRYRVTHPNFLGTADLLREVIQPRTKKSVVVSSQGLKVHDPVCGMFVTPATANFSTLHKGATFFFCASGCHSKFLRSPDQFA